MTDLKGFEVQAFLFWDGNDTTTHLEIIFLTGLFGMLY